ncbi:MAG: dephospho-CoA kinase [Ardenticatenaceae bacterium]|nr:dephospho-CoA kinase [Ardenticatenaceae bacterium]MCB9444610.1 dephospho-CoA kinase [Ardenticatenaceae bacterium]
MNEPGGTRLSGKLIVGLTGNIATGKSAVMRLAAEHGALTIDADKIVHELQDHDTEMQAAIGVAFGREVRLEDGRIDRRTLGKIVFGDAQAMADLEAIIHPYVRREVAKRIKESDKSIVFIEAIKLLEGALAKICHQIWVTRCSRQRQLDRLRICRGMDTETAVTRIKAQPSQEEKVARADIVIDTEGLMIDTEKQFAMAWERLPDPRLAGTRLLPDLPPQPPPQAAAPTPRPSAAELAPMEIAVETVDRPEGLEVRRARPADVAAMLLLMHKATNGAVQMKRAELLMALSERGYFIGQIGTEISALMGWNIDSQVARIDQIFIHPLEATMTTGLAILEEVEKSADAHVCEIILAFIADDAPPEIEQTFDRQAFGPANPTNLPQVWQRAVDESQPEGTHLRLKVLRDRRLQQ